MWTTYDYPIQLEKLEENIDWKLLLNTLKVATNIIQKKIIHVAYIIELYWLGFKKRNGQ